MASLAPELLQWLGSVLQPSYKDVNRTYSDVATTLQAFSTLSPRTDVFTYENGTSELLLCVSGILPVNFRGATYNIPVIFWLPHHYPLAPPIALVVPSSGMSIRPTNHVDPSGRCYHPYLTYWSKNPSLSFLVDLCAQLKDVFSKEPPVFAKSARPESPAVLQPPPPRPPLPPELAPPKPTPARQDSPDRAPPPPPKPHQAPPSVAQAPARTATSNTSSQAPVPPPAPPKPYELAHGHGQGTPAHALGQHFQYQPEQGASGSAAAQYQQNPLPPLPFRHSSLPRDNMPAAAAGGYAPQQQYQQPPQQQQQQYQQQKQQPLPPLPVPNLPMNQAPARSDMGPVPPPPPPHPTQQLPTQHMPKQDIPPKPAAWLQPQPGMPEDQGGQPKGAYAAGPPFPPQQPPPPPPPPPQQTQSPRFPIYAMPPRPVSIHGYPPSNSSPLNPNIPPPQKAPEPKKQIVDIMNIDDGFRLMSPSAAPPPLPPNPEKDRLLNEIALALHQRAEAAKARALTSLEQTASQSEAMSRTEAAMERERLELKRTDEICKKDIRILNERMAMADDVIKEAREREAPNIDAVVVAPTVVHTQLYELVTEDMAIEDTIYVLGKALDRERITLDIFLKHTRNLAREQFLKRALVKKISRQVGLT